MIRYALLFVLAIAIVAVLIFLAGRAGMLKGKPPKDIGVQDGKLKRPSRTENSVTSQADLWPDHPMRDYARIEPFKISGDGSAEMSKLVATLQAMPRTVIVQQDGGYLYAQCTTPLLQFTDDIEFYLDKAAGTIQVRSASRIGRKDLGVNRARVEQLRAAITQ